MLNTLKQRAKSLEDLRDKLYKLNGAGKCLDNDILPTQFQLIGKPVHTGVRYGISTLLAGGVTSGDLSGPGPRRDWQAGHWQARR